MRKSAGRYLEVQTVAGHSETIDFLAMIGVSIEMSLVAGAAQDN